VGTRKGLFRITRPVQDAAWQLDGPALAGLEVLHVVQAPDNFRRLYAATGHPIWGAHLYRSDDAGESWQSLDSTPHHPAGRHPQSLKAIWYLAPLGGDRLYAGIDPAGLFFSQDGGQSWQAVEGLNEHPTRPRWEPARGGFPVHSIHIDPVDGRRMVAAVSAGGVFRSADGGTSWEPANAGVRAENFPQRYPEVGHNVHRLVMAPSLPSRLYRQCYNGTYRSDDFAGGWVEISEGLPSDFGYAIAVDPGDADTVFQIPESGSHMRAVVDGRLQVFKSTDAGRTWNAGSQGLPQQHAYVSVLREAMDTWGSGPCAVAFGTTSGHVFVSMDAGRSWQTVAEFLPRILCLKALNGDRPTVASA
jgi:photosystem II stability/assembly factor-like uncharacterized protein